MTIRFPDLSHYVPNVDVSAWPALITKATEGTTYTDPTYASYKAAAGKAGIPFAGYHFLAHKVDVAAQAKHAYAVIGHVPAMLDVESGTTGSPTLTEVVAFVKAYRALGGTMTLIYLPHWYWQGNWGAPSLQVLEDLGLALISSAYTTYSDTGVGWNSYGGMKPAIWQYTSTPRDMNAFKGTIAELAALFAGTTGQGSVPIAGEDMPLTTDDVHTILTAKSLPADTPTMSLGTVVMDAQAKARAAAAGVDALTGKVDALAAKIAALPTTAAPAAPLSDADKDDIAKRVADLLAGRLES